MRQFDVFIRSGEIFTPPFTDSELGWFLSENFNDKLDESDAEWIIFADANISITREFLNELAENISGFPMVDAFAPQVRTPAGNFHTGLCLSKGSFTPLQATDKLRFIAAPHPSIAAFSRRIVQRTGRFDQTLPADLQLADFSLRMLHAGGKMFYVPYLVAEARTELASATEILQRKENATGLAFTQYKTLGFTAAFSTMLKNPAAFIAFFKNHKQLKQKSEKAMALSKLKKSTLQEIA